MLKEYKIKEPIWSTNSIGILDKRLMENDLIVSITYKTSDGTLLYPNKYIIRRKEVHKYPKQFLKNKTLYIIPIDKLEILDTN